ncbi:MAG: non-homologous end-joining DNA ligase [Candidatus Limnocylindria bacterium]
MTRVGGGVDPVDAEIQVDGRSVRLTNLDRVLWPATGFTKRDMLDYYLRVGPTLVPHLAGRPLMLGRFPEGVEGRGWGQFECRGRPDWMASVPLRLRTGVVREVCVVNDMPSLMWVVNQGVIELHPFLARADAFERPTSVVFDLDPGPAAGLAECARAALRLRGVLDEAGLRAYVKTSGSSGIHVFVPIDATHSYAETKAFARRIAARLASENPELVIDRMTRSLRAGRVFVDWAQNDERKQTVAPYSLRATARPLVSTPITWDEVGTAAAGSDPAILAFGPSQVTERTRDCGDLFAPVAAGGHRLPA